MIDLHSHLDLYENALSLVPQVSKRNLFTLVVTTSPRAWKATSKVFRNYENLKVALGLHPAIAVEKIKELDLLLNNILSTPYIGEIGIDATTPHQYSLGLQEEIFKQTIAESAKHGGRIISIHSKGAASKVLKILERYPTAGKPILHWFSGSMKELDWANSLGCWYSVGPAMLKSKKGSKIFQKLPLDKILPETDGPFVMKGNRPYMPWESMEILEVLESFTGMTNERLRLLMKQNLDRLLTKSKSTST